MVDMSDTSTDVKIRAVFESCPIRHIAVQCPACGKWFKGREITKENLYYEYEIDYAKFICPICGYEFGNNNSPYCRRFDNYNFDIEEVGSADECYKDCLEKKTVWE